MTAARLHCLVLAALSAGAAFGDEPSAAGPEIKREIRVRIACDEEWRALPGWERLARANLERASGVFERRFGIRWRVVDVVPWTSDDAAGALWTLLGQVERDVPRDGVDVLFGFTGQTHAKGSKQLYPFFGWAALFGPVGIVDGRLAETTAWSRQVVAHELGHMLGAWHSPTSNTVMGGWDSRERAEDRDPEFDPQNAALIELCRDFDFARGIASLDDAKRRRIDELIRAVGVPDMDISYLEAELAVNPDVRAVRAACARALANMEACVGPKDLVLGGYLRALTQAWMREPASDWWAAERFARRACDLAASNPDFRARFKYDELMASILGRRGRGRESLEWSRRLYALRAAADGLDGPEATELRAMLDRNGGTKPGKTWSQSVRPMTPTPDAEPNSTFETPRARTIHVRSEPSEAWKSDRLDEGVLSFEVAVPCRGRLTIELVQSGESAARAPIRATARVPAGFDPAHPTVVGLRYRSIDDVIDTGALLPYACRLYVESPSNSDARSGRADAPWDAAQCVASAFDFSDRTFTSLGDGAGLLFDRRWTAAATDDADAIRTWRLELTFVPDADPR